MSHNSWLNSNRVFILLPLIFVFSIGCALIQRQIELLGTQESTATAISSPSPAASSVVPSPTVPLITSTTIVQPVSIQLHNSVDISSLASALDWTFTGGYSSLRVPISGDLQAAESIELTAADLKPPASCLERPDCRRAVAIEISDQLPAITCQSTEQVLWKETCAIVSFPAGARFRIRGILYDTHPGEWNFIPILQVLPPSDMPCREGELRCEADNTCFASFDDYCRTCLGQEKERCACQSPQGDLPNGSDCQYWLSGDVLQAGKCQAGVCK